MMEKMPIPQHIKKILALLKNNGFAGYLVGGAVRDWLLGREAKDFDVATDAEPQQVCALAATQGWKVTENLGRNFGVVLLAVDGQPVETGTFRNEAYGEDAHRPAAVAFCKTLAEDLARRDFTINALAADLEGNIIDCYNGRADLRAGVLRAVGEADKRFSEDALRMFRACRFCAQLGFAPDREILQAIAGERKRAAGLSFERVKAELEKILLAPHADTGMKMLAQSGLAGQSATVRERGQKHLVPVLPELMSLKNDAFELLLRALVFAPQDLQVRWSMIFYAHAMDATAEFGARAGRAAATAAQVLSRFNYSGRFIYDIKWLLLNYDSLSSGLCNNDEKELLCWLKRQAQEKSFNYAKELAAKSEKLCQMHYAFFQAVSGAGEGLARMRSAGERLAGLALRVPVHTSDLAIRGSQVAERLGEDATGAFLRAALHEVQEGRLKNNERELLAYLHSWQK